MGGGVCAGGEAARTHPSFPRIIEKIRPENLLELGMFSIVGGGVCAGGKAPCLLTHLSQFIEKIPDLKNRALAFRKGLKGC